MLMHTYIKMLASDSHLSQIYRIYPPTISVHTLSTHYGGSDDKCCKLDRTMSPQTLSPGKSTRNFRQLCGNFGAVLSMTRNFLAPVFPFCVLQQKLAKTCKILYCENSASSPTAEFKLHLHCGHLIEVAYWSWSVLTHCYPLSSFHSHLLLIIWPIGKRQTLRVLLSKNTFLLQILVFELFAEQYRTFQALQQDGAAGAADGRGGDGHQRDPGSDQQHTGAGTILQIV